MKKWMFLGTAAVVLIAFNSFAAPPTQKVEVTKTAPVSGMPTLMKYYTVTLQTNNTCGAATYAAYRLNNEGSVANPVPVATSWLADGEGNVVFHLGGGCNYAFVGEGCDSKGQVATLMNLSKNETLEFEMVDPRPETVGVTNISGAFSYEPQTASLKQPAPETKAQLMVIGKLHKDITKSPAWGKAYDVLFTGLGSNTVVYAYKLDDDTGTKIASSIPAAIASHNDVAGRVKFTLWGARNYIFVAKEDGKGNAIKVLGLEGDMVKPFNLATPAPATIKQVNLSSVPAYNP